MEDLAAYLGPTDIIDCGHAAIGAYAAKAIGPAVGAVDRAVRLYYAVRDDIRYDPYYPFHRAEYYRASAVLQKKRGFCIPKAALLCACGRAAGIPTRLGFADVRNHLATPQLLEFLGSDTFVYHAFVEFFLEGRWIKATPAFNRELCARHGTAPLEFDGREDSIFQPYNSVNRPYMEYMRFHGSYADVPVARIVRAFQTAYGRDRVGRWIDNADKCGDIRASRTTEA